MKGEILGVRAIMVSTPKKNIYSVIGVVEGAGLEVVDITISGLADYHEVRNDKLDNKVDIASHNILNLSLQIFGIIKKHMHI